jgi:hypothetical protein
MIEFESAGSGKTAWFAVQIGYEGKQGPWAVRERVIS